VVDDSPHARQILRRILEADPAIAAVEGAANGKLALEKARRRPPHLVTLDLQMPVMDGFTFLRLFRARSSAPVLVLSSHADLSNVEKALALGASGFVSKPTDPYRNLQAIGAELRLKLRLHTAPSPSPAPGLGRGFRPPVRALERTDFPVLAVGSSSGGPSTLQYLLSGLPRDLSAAVLIAQHMPAGFTQTFAKRLDVLLPHPVGEANDGDRVRAGEVMIGPGGRNFGISRGEPLAVVAIEAPGDALYVPSVDRLFETAANAFGDRLTAVVLTGMGKDGSSGVRAVKERGGRVIAESEETAAVYGMPREAVATGCVDEVLPLPEIAVRVIRLAGGEDRAEPVVCEVAG
jgi:two-component system chemotaxis response regulator CheB